MCGYAHDGRVTRVARDAQGRVTGIEGPSGRWSYCYNEAGSLTSATGPRTHHTWTHDAYGRLTSHATSETDTIFTWDQEGHLTQTRTRANGHDSAIQYRYDAAGRRVSATSPDGPGERYSWDGRGWLSGITTGSTTLSTHVDALGRASRITTGDQQVRVDWDFVTGAPTSIDGHHMLPLPGGRILGAAPIGDTNLWREAMPTDPGNPYQPGTVAIEGVPEAIRMAGNALVVDGHPWWGARLYDPTTTTFLSPDPLAPPAGALWANNPYDYASTNPLALTDPFGTHPVTDGQLAGLTHPVRHWWATHKDRILSRDFLIGAGLVIGGIAVAATGVGGPLLAAAISGGLISGGFSASSQKYATGDVNWGTVSKEALIGFVVGAVGTGTTNLVGSQLLKHSDTAAAAITKFSARDEVKFAQTGLRGILNGRTAANNALKLAAKSGDSDALETMYLHHFAGSTASSFAASNTQYIMDTAMSHDKHFSASGLAQANGNAIFGMVLSARGKAMARPSISINSEGFKRGPALLTDTMGVKQQFSTFGHELARGAIADAATQEISTAMKGQDPHDFADGFSKKTAHTLGNAAHTSFPGLHASK